MNPLIVSLLTALSVGLLVEPARVFWIRFARVYLDSLIAECEAISYETPNLNFWLTVWGLAMAACVGVGVVVFKPLLGLNAALILFVVPKQTLLFLLRRRRTLLKEQLVSALSLITKTIKTGKSLEQTFASVGKELDAPLNREFRKMAYECSRGRVFDKVLEDSKNRLKIPEYVVFITALSTNKKRGGDVTVTLEEIRRSLMENRRLDRKLEADTSTGRFTINSLACVPPGFVLLSYVMNPTGTVLLFTTTVGNLVLITATILTYVGFRWGQKIVEIEF